MFTFYMFDVTQYIDMHSIRTLHMFKITIIYLLTRAIIIQLVHKKCT